MIASLRGQVYNLSLDSVIVDVSGVGYLLQVPVGTQGRVTPAADGRASFHVHTNVREDAITLYGFATFEEKRLFTRLITVNGVGPKLALAVLSDLNPSEFIRAVRNSDVKVLQQVSGIGKKIAQRLILELKGAVDDFDFAELAPPDAGAPENVADDLRSALVNLGYRDHDIDEVLAAMGSALESADDLEPLLREALKMLR